MRIVDIREQAIPLAADMENAFVSFAEMTASLVAVVSDESWNGERLVGFGHTSVGRYAQSGILRERLIPRVLRANPETIVDDGDANLSPEAVWRVAMKNEKPGGHGDRAVAMAALDMAIWDLVAKVERRPLFRVIADRYGDGQPDPRVEVYAAGGYYYGGEDLLRLRDELGRYLAAGYTAVKIKVGGGALREDTRRVEVALDVVNDASRLAVDANARFGRDEAIAYASALAPYSLRWYEEPVDPLDVEAHAELTHVYANPIATGENLFAAREVDVLLGYGGLRPDIDILQVDPGLAYGLVGLLEILEVMRARGWSPSALIPHGGHRFALHLAAGLGLGGAEAYPEVFQPIGAFGADVSVRGGRVAIPDVPGIGFEADPVLSALFTGLIAG